MTTPLKQAMDTPVESIRDAIYQPPARQARPATDWCQTFTGRKFWPLAPRPAEVCIEDIAHALALKCRFGGHCLAFYSVAQHSVLVSQSLAGEPRGVQRWGLLHDAAEAYLADIPRPVKPRIAGWKPVEQIVMQAVAERFGLGWGEPAAVKRADNALLATERRDLMRPGLATQADERRAAPRLRPGAEVHLLS